MYYCSFIYKCNKLTNVIYSFTNAMNTFINVCSYTFTNVINIFIIAISKFDNEFSTFTYVNKIFIDVNLKTCTINIIFIKMRDSLEYESFKKHYKHVLEPIQTFNNRF